MPEQCPCSEGEQAAGNVYPIRGNGPKGSLKALLVYEDISVVVVTGSSAVAIIPEKIGLWLRTRKMDHLQTHWMR